MKIQDIFTKPIGRTIEGVIKADDVDELDMRNELEEYVITNEISKRLGDFLEVYNDYQGANGVWISGFFGSGKSHLLKMLAYLLENHVVDNKPAIDYFLPKCEDDAFLTGALKKAIATPSRSILFNIDQKADIKGKDQPDAVLSVFVKVFNSFCGYYGNSSYVANFERDLDDTGLYEAFKDAYREISGNDWLNDRKRVVLNKAKIDAAYQRVTGETADNIIQSYREDETLSIEDFCKNVKKYLDKQPAGFRLNFFVDEVGQYIANRTELMVNLQTIAETLATTCKGRSWIIVTAQEDMDSVLGRHNQQLSNDFTKIQARFKTRMKLTSMNVAEVIQKRLLAKTSDAQSALCSIYDRQHNNFKTLFDFVDDSRHYSNFKDEDHFVMSYPFIPYQFDLFQSSIENLSTCHAFEGKHSSVGERSMLGVFQEVAKQIRTGELGELATFDMMFEGIRNSLKSQVQSSIALAEKNLEDDFAVRVLKALFLVKYVPNFKATLPNISILMYSYFDQDISTLKSKIQAALAKLEKDSYIERNGSFYSFLTDEEKNIESQIKETDIQDDEVTRELSNIIFKEVVNQVKIRDPKTKQDYPFSQKIDGVRMNNQEFDLGIDVQAFRDVDSSNIVMQSYGEDALFVCLPSSNELYAELLMYKKTEQFIRHHTSMAEQSTYQRILNEKKDKNVRRRQAIVELVEELLQKADLFVKGEKVDSSGSPSERIQRAFLQLVSCVYIQRLTQQLTEDDITKNLKPTEVDVPLSEQEMAVMNAINRERAQGLRVDLSRLMDAFKKKPYGWTEVGTLVMVASLFARGKIELLTGIGSLSLAEVKTALLNSRERSKISILPIEEISPRLLRNLKEFASDFFNKPIRGNDAKSLVEEVQSNFASLANDLRRLPYSGMPFADKMDEEIKRFDNLAKKDRDFYFKEFFEETDDLEVIKSDFIALVQQFFNSAQKDIYGEAARFVHDQQSNESLLGKDFIQLKNLLADQCVFSGNQVRTIKTLFDRLKEEVRNVLNTQKQEAISYIERKKDAFRQEEIFSRVPDSSKDKVLDRYDQLIRDVENANDCLAVLQVTNFFENKEQGIAQYAESLVPRVVEPKPDVHVKETTMHMTWQQIRPNSKELKSEQDVEDFVMQIQVKLMAALKNGKTISID